MGPKEKHPPATRILRRVEGCVPVCSAGLNIEDREKLHLALQHSMSAIDGRTLAGTKKLRFSDLLDHNTGLVIRQRASRVSPSGSDIPDVLEWLKTRISTAKDKKVLVLAGAGQGKTTASLLLFHEMANAYLDSQSGVPFPVLIDLRTERNALDAPDYGTSEWLNSFVEARYGKPVGALHSQPTYVSRPLCLILDSLDEVLAGRSFVDVRSILERYLFTESAVVLCRSHFYEQYLQYLPFVMDREIVSLAEWDTDNVISYIHAFCKKVRSDGYVRAATEFVEWMQTSRSLESILRVPIRLNMALDMYSSEGEMFPSHRTLLQLYEAYISWSINLERSRTNADFEETYRLLEDLAWETYSERYPPGGTAQATTERSLRAFLGARIPRASNHRIESIWSLLLNLGLLSISGDRLPGRDRAIDFVHKSFQECLVATRVAEAIATSPQDSANMCASYLSPAVSEFLKEAIERLNTHPREVSKAVTVLMDAITPATTTDIIHSHEEPNTNRLMVEQLCYYLGNLQSRTAQTFLLSRLEKEADEWIRRGIAVGLAFGGQYKPLERYVTELRVERTRGGETPKSDANIGFHLSFFGDQPFDPESPDRDMGFEECGKTVDRLVYQLGTDTNRPNWRIDLYTLLDLRHRSVSTRSYWAMMRANVASLRRVYERFSADPEVGSWVETCELAEVLRDVRFTGEAASSQQSGVLRSARPRSPEPRL